VRGVGVAMKSLFLNEEDVVHKVDIKPGGYILIEVSDTGGGIEADVIEKIFEPYFTTKKEEGGTGLGLATVHSIVREHGGALSVYSEVGLGTTFQVYLPKLKEQKEKTDQNSLLYEQNSTGTEHILIVDDEDIVVELIRSMLTQLGYRVTAQTDSTVAWEIFEQNPDTFDLLLTDMAMPHMTGIELAKKVLLSKPNFPIILCTGFSEMINKEKAEAIGIREYLMKPVLKSRLSVSVRRALGDEK
ncbi:MAG: response regulator, partial [Candidatus Electrothrix sp. AR4]|nr:response regulator [Candidatus Electrothrix sp. AR4]